MPKVAYLTGIPGAGKSFIGNEIRLGNLAHVVAGDEVRRRAVQIMCPDLKPGFHVWDEDLWDQLCLHCNMQVGMTASVSGFVFPTLERGRPLLIDAYVTSHLVFRRTFSAALKRGQYDITEERLFWIDPPLEQVVKQANARITNGERPGEGPIDESEARRRRQRIVNREPPRDAVRESNPQRLIEMLEEFFTS